ncbi:MAG: 4-alpha-glucanotransferase, partial [Okeania sp. SIO1H5]|uniref:4-alpha-glucanotransferase n=1 Tax=Okeania sp. SIO1H5 TaxID=2607777 RepID=UPI0013B61FFF
LGHPVEADSVSQILVRLAMMSIADTVILACQDLLDLGSDARMNRPGTKDGNWDWRLLPGQLGEGEQKAFSDMTYLYQRQRSA